MPKIKRRSSDQGHTVDALAPGTEEGRGKLRKAPGSRKQAVIRGFPNGETWRSKPPSPAGQSIAGWGEARELKHLSSGTKRKQNRSVTGTSRREVAMPQVVASERGTAQTGFVEKPAGVANPGLRDSVRGGCGLLRKLPSLSLAEVV